jgi:hypothetical protein
LLSQQKQYDKGEEGSLSTSELKPADPIQAAPFIADHYVLGFAGIPEDKTVEDWSRDYKENLYAQSETVKVSRYDEIMRRSWLSFQDTYQVDTLSKDLSKLFPFSASALCFG